MRKSPRFDGSAGSLAISAAVTAHPSSVDRVVNKVRVLGVPVTLLVIPSVAYADAEFRRAISPAIQRADETSPLVDPAVLARGNEAVLREAWPTLLGLAKRVVVIPSRKAIVGAGTIDLVLAALAGRVPVFALDPATSRLLRRFHVEPPQQATLRCFARLVFPGLKDGVR